jgi:hypothetical protein
MDGQTSKNSTFFAISLAAILLVGTVDVKAYLPRWEGADPQTAEREQTMMKLWAVLLVLASFVLVAPVVESGTSGSLNLFVAVGNADGGGGGE